MQFAQLLSTEEVEKIHDGALEILENVGIFVCSEKAREIFAAHNCPVDTDKHIVKIPRSAELESFDITITPIFIFS